MEKGENNEVMKKVREGEDKEKEEGERKEEVENLRKK